MGWWIALSITNMVFILGLSAKINTLESEIEKIKGHMVFYGMLKVTDILKERKENGNE